MKAGTEIFALCDRIRETSYALHRYLRHGHMEKVYENGLTHRLRNVGIKVEQQYPLQVLDKDGTVLGDYLADLFVEDCLIIELKAALSTLLCKILMSQFLKEGEILSHFSYRVGPPM